MDYFRVHDTGDDWDPDRWFLDVPRAVGATEGDPWEFTCGNPLYDRGDLVVAQRVEGRPQALSFAAFDIPIANAQLASALRDVAGDDLQMLPVMVDGLDEPYFVVNVVRVVKCLDERLSEYTKYPAGDKFGRGGRYRMVTRLRIDKGRVRGCKVIRIEGWLTPLIVSEQVRSLLRAWHVPGVFFDVV